VGVGWIHVAEIGIRHTGCDYVTFRSIFRHFYAITFIIHGNVIILYWQIFIRHCEFKASWYSSRSPACCNKQNTHTNQCTYV